jgi:hypothetical protein
MEDDHQKYGFVNSIRWVIYQRAFLTASGRNEIIAGAYYRSQCVEIARTFGYKLTQRGGYGIVALKKIQKEN